MMGARTAAWSGKSLPYLRRVAYLHTYGGQGIDTGIVPDNSTDFTIDLMVKDVEGKTARGVFSVTGHYGIYYENKLYNLSSLDTVANDTYYEAVVQARTINSMLKELPEFKDITASYKTAVEQIRALYDGLDDYQKGFVSKDDVETLERYESKIAELVEAEENTEG